MSFKSSPSAPPLKGNRLLEAHLGISKPMPNTLSTCMFYDVLAYMPYRVICLIILYDVYGSIARKSLARLQRGSSQALSPDAASSADGSARWPVASAP